MKLMTCPLNGPRNISEFVTNGEVHIEPDGIAANDDEWTNHIWYGDTKVGVVREWWCHTPSNYWFIAERNTVTDEVLRTYPVSELLDGGR